MEGVCAPVVRRMENVEWKKTEALIPLPTLTSFRFWPSRHRIRLASQARVIIIITAQINYQSSNCESSAIQRRSILPRSLLRPPKCRVGLESLSQPIARRLPMLPSRRSCPRPECSVSKVHSCPRGRSGRGGVCTNKRRCNISQRIGHSIKNFQAIPEGIIPLDSLSFLKWGHHLVCVPLQP